MPENLVPLAEHFHSIQGEGTYVGTPMHFIRLAGCSVGSRATADFTQANLGTIPILQNGIRGSKCRTYDGRFFDCDTNFHLQEKVELERLLDETYEHHICLTGGEPLDHLKSKWMTILHQTCINRDIMIHIETSGTVEHEFIAYSHIWLTVAPKLRFATSMIHQADEVKLLVDDLFDIANVHESILSHNNVFLSPINSETTVDWNNLHHCMSLLREHPTWRLSCQWHKFLGVR
jgi:7-carboxy-7-deazaguanine synthase